MTESKITLTHRLQREGRWDEATRFKDEKAAELRKNGMTRKDAQQAGWKAMGEKYPPLPEVDEPGDVQPVEPAIDQRDVDAILARAADNPPDATKGTLWVYQHLNHPTVSPADAPSLGGWSMLQWAKENRNRFFEQVWPKAAAKMQTPQQDYEDDPLLAELEEMIAICQRDWDDQAIADTPATIRESVKAAVADWMRHNRIEGELPTGACNDLQLRMVEIANNLRKAIEGHVRPAAAEPA